MLSCPTKNYLMQAGGIKRRLSDLESLGIPKQQRLLAEHILQSIPRSLMGFFLRLSELI